MLKEVERALASLTTKPRACKARTAGQAERSPPSIKELSRFTEVVEQAAANYTPHSLVYYLRDVANAFHTYYQAEKWIAEDAELRNARLALVQAAGQVIRNGLAMLGVSAPESM